MTRKSDLDNRSNQLNPNHPEYANCRNHRSSSHDEDYGQEQDSKQYEPRYYSPTTHQVKLGKRPEPAINSMTFPPIVDEPVSLHVATIVTAFVKMKW